VKLVLLQHSLNCMSCLDMATSNKPAKHQLTHLPGRAPAVHQRNSQGTTRGVLITAAYNRSQLYQAWLVGRDNDVAISEALPAVVHTGRCQTLEYRGRVWSGNRREGVRQDRWWQEGMNARQKRLECGCWRR
jgi:hypothetical protein